MKIIAMDLDSIVLYLSDMDFSLHEDIDLLEEQFWDIFLRLKNLYDMDIEGYYKIDIYKDNYYGIIVEIEAEELEYFDYFDNQVDMRIAIHEDTILYEFSDFFSIPNSLSKKMKFYTYHNKIYGALKNSISKIEGAYLQEHAYSIVYGSTTKHIVQKKNHINEN